MGGDGIVVGAHPSKRWAEAGSTWSFSFQSGTQLLLNLALLPGDVNLMCTTATLIPTG